MRNAIQSIVAPSIVAMILGACGGSDEPAKAPENPPSAAEASPPPSADAGPTSVNVPPPATEPAPPPPNPTANTDRMPSDSAPLTDDQILEITHVANTGEIEQAKLAQTKSKDARVKKLAAMMIKDHSAADTKGVTLAKKDNFSPSSSAVSTSIESDANDKTSMLKGQTGTDFDKSYVDTQIKEHQAVLDTIDQKLLPNAKNADVKAYLTEVRSKVSMHLQHAQMLQTDLAK